MGVYGRGRRSLPFLPSSPAMADIQLEKCPASAPFFGFMGVTAAIVFCSKCRTVTTGQPD